MTPLNYFDIHSHLYFPDFDADREAVIANLKEQGIWTTTIGTDLESSRKAVELAEQHENMYATVGVHPDEHNTTPEIFSSQSGSASQQAEFEELAKHPKVVAIGECGFDFYRTPEENLENARAQQKEIFEAQIDLAIRHGKALMLHGRPTKGTMNAYEDMLDVLEPYAQKHGKALWGNAHFFVGSEEILRRFLDIGFTISFTGVITFVREYDSLVCFAPVDRIHAETDAPFVAPLSQRGKNRSKIHPARNSPEYVPEIVAALAVIRSEDTETLQKQLILNAKQLFRLA